MPLFTLKEDGGVLLITEETETAFKVWWITYADEPLAGYIAKSDISDISISEETRQTLKEQRPCGFIASDIGYMDAFVLFGELTMIEEAPEATPTPEPQAPLLQAGDYAAATTETRIYLSIDETMTENDTGDGWQGVFTHDAVVYVESVQQDALGRDWCEVRYLFGADDADGKLIWTDTDTLFVPMDDLSPTDAHELTVTDYAYPFEPLALYASADFNLRDYNASVKTFYVVSSEVFSFVDYQIYKCLWQWAKRRHKHKGHKWIAKRYWHHIDNRVWTFAAVLNPGNKNTDATYLQLVYATNTKIIRFHKIVAEANPFDERWTGYYEEREGEKLLNSTKGREKLLAIWRAQKHTCPVCGEKITADTGFRTHIVTLNEYSRRTSMVHPLCHRQLHDDDYLL